VGFLAYHSADEHIEFDFLSGGCSLAEDIYDAAIEFGDLGAAPFRDNVSSVHAPSWADFIATMVGLRGFRYTHPLRPSLPH
jgi:hypothetical protein